jgi:lipopolysaccharide transport system ATP-binding protein
MGLAIRAAGLGKMYRVGEQQPRYHTLRESLRNAAYGPLRRVRSLLRGERQRANQARTFWALKDVSFNVGVGETVGIIGHNGAGKSTLLKLISRITEPTEGEADVHGRVSSLLEVGTGFHGELTGRENIYLNGAILGMKRAEIDRKFDEIVAFAEVERFLDTAVKHYSSGMHMRLAFAVAAHLEPDILIVDEVLAVGDAAFRRKCLGKMEAVAGEGRTVLFVSHDMTNVSILCDKVILLERGKVQLIGEPAEVISAYAQKSAVGRTTMSWTLDEAPGDGEARIVGVRATGSEANGDNCFALQRPVTLTVEFAVLADGVRLNPACVVKNTLGTTVFITANYDEPDWGLKRYGPGRYRASCTLPAHLLNDGYYTVDVLLMSEMEAARASAEAAITLDIYDDGTTRGDFIGRWDGIVRPRCQWVTGSGA